MGWDHHHLIDIPVNFAYSLQQVQDATQLISLEHVLKLYFFKVILHFFIALNSMISENLHSSILTGWFVLMQVGVLILLKSLMSVIVKSVNKFNYQKKNQKEVLVLKKGL